jgi:hypothetical protein
MPKITINISEVAETQLRHLAEAETAADLAAEQRLVAPLRREG